MSQALERERQLQKKKAGIMSEGKKGKSRYRL
jgi:hypothetical protein